METTKARGRQGVKGKQGIQGVSGEQGVQGPGWDISDIGLLHEKIDAVGKEVQELTKVIWKGNGTPAVLTRLDRIETASQTNSETVGQLAKETADLLESVKFCKDEIIKHPSINRWIASSPSKAFATLGGLLVSIAAALVGLHAVISLPGVALWVEKLLGLP